MVVVVVVVVKGGLGEVVKVVCVRCCKVLLL